MEYFGAFKKKIRLFVYKLPWEPRKTQTLNQQLKLINTQGKSKLQVFLLMCSLREQRQEVACEL